MERRIRVEGVMIIDDGHDENGNPTWDTSEDNKNLPTIKELLENKETIQEIIEEQIFYTFEFEKCELIQ